MEQPITELEILQSAAQAGQWGFSFDMRQVGASPTGQALTNSLLTLDTPEWFARPWTLNLLAPRYQGGIVAAPANGEPLENAISLPSMFVRVDYGVGAAIEQVEFDYPARGATVQFHASIIRCYLVLPTTFGAAAPLVGGFLTPGSRGNVAADALPCCTWTSGAFTFAPAGPTQFAWAPRRARGYRIVPGSLSSIGTTLQVQSVRFDQTVISADVLGADFDGSVGPLVTSRNAFVPLLPGAVGISIRDTLGAGSATYFVQWLLDIG